MSTTVFKDDAARERMEEWYQRFLDKVPVQTKSIEVSTSFGSSHVLTIGDATKPPLLCLHSMLTSSAHLASELTALLDRFYLIAPDIPGQSVRGLPIRLPYTDNSHAQWLMEIVDELKLTEFHLLGVSLGGFVARQFASLYPKRVQSLTFLVPAGITQGSLVAGLTKMAIPLIRYKMNSSDRNLRKLVEPLITTWDNDWANYIGDSFNDFVLNTKIPPLASKEDLENLTMPCLVLGAEEDISFPGEQLIAHVNEHIPSVECELIKGSRHCPPTTPEFRKWLGDRVIGFIGDRQ